MHSQTLPCQHHLATKMPQRERHSVTLDCFGGHAGKAWWPQVLEHKSVLFATLAPTSDNEQIARIDAKIIAVENHIKTYQM